MTPNNQLMYMHNEMNTAISHYCARSTKAYCNIRKHNIDRYLSKEFARFENTIQIQTKHTKEIYLLTGFFATFEKGV
jgi:hypothetical protein